MKRIQYRGGLVEFDLPRHWLEEYVPLGGGTFYEDRPDSGTLRLNVLEIDEPEGTTAEEMMSKPRKPIPGAVDEHLRDGLVLRRYMKQVEENGEALHLYRWEVSMPVQPRPLRAACFSHTIVAEQEAEESIMDELAMIDASVRAATFSQEPGVTGEYHHANR